MISTNVEVIARTSDGSRAIEREGNSIWFVWRVPADEVLTALPNPDGLTLTRREREMFDRIMLGLSNKEIAADLKISVRTVKFHASAIYSKMNVSGRNALMGLTASEPLRTVNIPPKLPWRLRPLQTSRREFENRPTGP